MHKFGTDGIRSKAEDFAPELLAKIIRGLRDYGGDNIKVFLAGDTRESTEWILQDLETALETFGIEYSNAGVLPTPAINYCFYNMGFDFAIDVTASHNPYEDNGIKIFERGENSGRKLNKKARETIEDAINNAEFSFAPASPTIRESLHEEALNLYLGHLLSYIDPANFSGLNIAMDCANGAVSVIANQIFEQLGATTHLLYADSTYGTGINQACGSTHLEDLTRAVTTNHLDFGVAFDGDGDRVLMVDENGEVVDGDEIIAILANHLNLDKIAITVMANQGLLNWAKDNNIKAEITAVGDYNVTEAMRANDIKLGGEQSGHIILPGESTGDGMLTALVITKIISETNTPLHELKKLITKFPQVIVNMPATPTQKTSLKENPEAKSLLLEYSKKLDSVSGRLLVRPSGTENLIRITMWGNDESIIKKLADDLKNNLISSLT